MSFVDNDPPKHLDIGSLHREESVNIYKSGSKKSYKYHVWLSLDEIKVLIAHGEKYFFNIKTNSKKEYNAALEIQKRARKYIEEAKTKTEDDTHTL